MGVRAWRTAAAVCAWLTTGVMWVTAWITWNRGIIKFTEDDLQTVNLGRPWGLVWLGCGTLALALALTWRVDSNRVETRRH